MKTVLQQLEEAGVSNVMPASVKNKWLKALRSGKYEQGQGELYTAPTDKTQPQFCCLGVLEHCLTGGVEFDCDDIESLGYPSKAFMEDFNIQFVDDTGDMVGNPHFMYAGELIAASELNDDKELTFKQIANIIEKQVKTI